MFEAYLEGKKFILYAIIQLGDLTDIKSRFLDPLKEISLLYCMPKDNLTLAFLVSNLAKMKHES